MSDRLATGVDAGPNRDQAWSIALEVPFGGGDDLAEPDAFETLTDGIALTGRYSLFWFKSAANALNDKNLPFRSRIMPQAIKACEEASKERDTDPAECDMMPDPQFARKYLNDARVNRSLFSTMLRVGVEGSVGLDRFAHLDDVTLDEVKVEHPKFSAAVFGAVYPPDAQSAYIGKLEYQNQFESEDKAVVCKAVVVNPDDDCEYGVPVAPAKVEKLNLEFEYRRAFKLDESGNSFAFAPSFEIDTFGGEGKAEFPIYLILDTELPFLPGLSLKYDSEEDDFDIGVFLRTSFAFE